MPKGDGLTYEQRFWSRVNKRSGVFAVINGVRSECWEWAGCLNVHGYGAFWWNGMTRRAHQFALELAGVKVPNGMVPDHLCRNIKCVRPDHLEPVTRGVNALRGDTFVARNAAKTHCPQGHPLIESNIVRTPSGGRSCKECHKQQRRKWWLKNLDSYRAKQREYMRTYKKPVKEI